MLTHIRFQNFKSWADTGDIALKPITGLFGPNSSGKTSILQAKAANIIAVGPLPGGITGMLARSGLKYLAQYIPGGVAGCEPHAAAASSVVGMNDSKE